VEINITKVPSPLPTEGNENNKPYKLLKIRWWRPVFQVQSQVLLFQPRLKSPPPVIPGAVLAQRKSKMKLMNTGQVVFANSNSRDGCIV
jgi:hypothetical protein